MYDRTLDPLLADEIALLQDLIVAASQTADRLTPQQLDALLGIG